MLAVASSWIAACVVPDLMLLTVLVGFFLIGVSQTPHRVDLLDMLDSGLITIVDPAATTRLIRVLGLLLA